MTEEAVPTFRFVAGKGGVGKTTLAAARAVALAAGTESEAGEGVLVVSTDPAHSLGDALDVEAPLTGGPRAVHPGLLAAELDARTAWRRWLGVRRDALHTLAERGTWLAPEEVARLLDLPVPGVDELIGLLELVRLARQTGVAGPSGPSGPSDRAGCSRVVVDTAPTAHTLRLLAMPAALERLAAVLAALRDRHRAVADALSGRSWAGDEADALADALADDARALGELIRDPERARFTWVLLPEALSLAESRDALAALAEAGAHVDEIVVNRVAPPAGEEGERCSSCDARRRAEAAAIREARELAPPGARLLRLPEVDEEPRGADALASLWALRRPAEEGESGAPPEGPPGEAADAPAAGSAAPPWLDDLIPPGLRLLMLGGKGGVGKTTCAAALAVLAARRRSDRPVLLLSTDPAHSLGDVLATELSDEPAPVTAPNDVQDLQNLRARELDAPAAFARLEARYRDALDTAFSGLARPGTRSASSGIETPLDRAVVERLFEATPPGLDELVALAELLDLTEAGEPDGTGRLVIVDTAPTGHALRLLEMPEIALEWDHALLSILLEYREALGLPGDLARELVELSKRLKGLRSLLADPARCGFAVVTRAGELPLRETRRLLGSLHGIAGAGIAVPAVILNRVPEGECGRCRRRASAAREAARELGRAAGPAGADGEPAAPAILTAPAEYPPPRGARALERWARSWSRLEPIGPR